MKNKAASFLLVAFFAAAVMAQQPNITNAKLETRALSGGLQNEFTRIVASASAPLWVGYSAPLERTHEGMCCYCNGACRGCKLEGQNDCAAGAAGRGPVKLEGSARMAVLFRVENHAAGRMRVVSEDCPVDAGGLPVYWLTGVQAAESVRLLDSFARREQNEHRNGALMAIAMHAGPEADQALARMVRPTEPDWLRERASFWLGVERGRKGYELLRQMIRNDPSEHVRDKVVFALSQSREPEAVNTIIEAAKTDRSAHVRGQALFWLAQKAGKRAEAAITDAIENDPETEVKKRAVFALSQLPKDEGVPLLIQVARNNKNPAARKQAMFWLGQSHDPRALQYFEEVLGK